MLRKKFDDFSDEWKGCSERERVKIRGAGEIISREKVVLVVCTHEIIITSKLGSENVHDDDDNLTVC
jgi:hypothetical protein